jgi:type I restriction enzyme S subunit
MAEPFIYDTSLRITEEAASTRSRLVPPRTVLVVVRGMSLAKEFRVALTMRRMAFNQDLKALHCADDIDSEFIFYALRSRQAFIRDLSTDASHGTKKLESDVLASVKIRVPALVVQKRVVQVARSYDDLIENNRRRIALLEQAARLLYEEWFVHFRFPGHEHVKFINSLPAGWKRPLLGEYAPFKYGKALRDDLRLEGDVPVYGSSGIVGTHNKAFVDDPAIIIGRKGNVGAVYFSEAPFWPIDTTYFIDNENVSRFLFFALHRLQFINTDVAVPGLNRDFAHSRHLIVPTESLLNQYEESVCPLFKMARNLKRQNNHLQEARDLLLPRLMSGEVEV